MTVTAVPVQRRDRVGWGDLVWLTWRQHRWSIGALAVLLGLGAVLSLALAAFVRGSGRVELFGLIGVYGLSRLVSLVPMAVGAVVAVFWAAPLVAREYEQKTSVVVWSQDLSPARWVVGKIVLLGVPAVGLSAGFGAAVLVLQRAVNGTFGSDFQPYQPFEQQVFESTPLVQVGYAAFGFALGLALSALTRRTIVAMALTLGGFIVVRMVVALGWRPYFQTPVREVWSYGETGERAYSQVARDNGLHVTSGYLDSAGREVDFPMICARTSTDGDSFQKCMADQGIVSHFTDYQPVERVGAFQVFEFFVFAAPAAALLVFAYYWVKRSHRI
ncbi:ABC transporter permease [Saccharothrix sp. NPDC042600]|uniref:ABC transporter permease n=1 Tax=Saccharothrix TaxID=2071 RepID=UPI0033F3EDAA|nr:ABC transporter permease [Saccharothrix mutabilis subsp. capreolus]